ncbi:hypothetical protein OS493_020132 [Desmophyllum pertusum]|uniref:Uncharacterized protein n=1 Tax=Desmophyllum pertusum TaxID=174260 RepID=A0A9X0D8B7_9CNID|nr:hypothetical protein OS493_020132 [Desmophyllum pertusum]
MSIRTNETFSRGSSRHSCQRYMIKHSSTHRTSLQLSKVLLDFLAVLWGKIHLLLFGAAIEVVGNFATKCNTGPLKELIGKVEKWLTFGKGYQALENSNDLDFDKVDIGSVPEVMKVKILMFAERSIPWCPALTYIHTTYCHLKGYCPQFSMILGSSENISRS